MHFQLTDLKQYTSTPNSQACRGTRKVWVLESERLKYEPKPGDPGAFSLHTTLHPSRHLMQILPYTLEPGNQNLCSTVRTLLPSQGPIRACAYKQLRPTAS